MLVQIKWRDACDFSGSRADYSRKLPLVCTTGWLVHRDSDKYIVRYHGLVDEDDAMPVNNEDECVVIPVKWVEEIVGIKKPRWRKIES